MTKTHTVSQKNNKMLVNLLLKSLLVMIALGGSSARGILGEKGKGNELYYVTGIPTTFAQKGPIDPVEDGYMRTLGLGRGGKKLMAHEEASIESKNEKGACGEASKLSGDEKDAEEKSIGRFKEQKDDQKRNITMISPNALKFTSSVIPRSCLPSRISKSSQDSNNHLEAAKEIMTLIHKDYNGAASRRSPINNQEPRNSDSSNGHWSDIFRPTSSHSFAPIRLV